MYREYLAQIFLLDLCFKELSKVSWNHLIQLWFLVVLVFQDKELRDVGDWRKNIEDKSGMDGRKKMFEAEA